MLAFDVLRGLAPIETRVTYSEQDTLLYALAVGLGGAEPEALRYVYEKQLVSAPTLAMVQGHRLPWLRMPETGIDVRKLLHGESSLAVHQPLPVAGELRISSRVTRVVDRGAAKGALVSFENEVCDATDGTLLATVGGSFLFPQGGGPGDAAAAAAVPPPPELPEREPDHCVEQFLPDAAAQLYRLTGDRNPLHVDSEVAAAARLEKPLLHGLCTFGHAAGALLRSVAAWDSARLRRISARYSAPMYPGETLRTEIFDLGGGEFGFRCWSVERHKLVLSNGHATIQEAS